MLDRGVIIKLATTPDSIEHILQSAVVVNWAELMGGHPNGLIQIEYGFAPGGTLEYLRIWSSIKRGYWLLACSYWMSASVSLGSRVRFENGFESRYLANILEAVMQHQNLFAVPLNLGRPEGMVQVAVPTDMDSKAAGVSINYAFNCVNSASSPVTSAPSLPLTA